MVGTTIFNLVLGILAFLITFVTALSGNVILVSLERAVYAFLLFFLLAYPIRWLTSFVLGNRTEKTIAGNHVDLVTPHESTEVPKEKVDELEESFTPLVAPRIERLDGTADPTQVANLIRRFTDD
jgi:hypothetical protein